MVQSTQTPRARKPRVLTVVRDPDPAEVDAPIDWSDWYLSEEEDAGQGPELDDVVVAFASSLEELLHRRELGPVRVGRDAFFAWIENEPNVRISPDVYLLADPPAPPWPKMWETWRPGHEAPRFALEVVSDDWRKDYDDAPPKYAMLGVEELVIYDPVAARGASSSKQRIPLQLYRRTPDGAFVRIHAGPGPARSETLDAWLHSRPEGGVGWLRLAEDRAGSSLIPTARERADRLAARLRELGLDPDEPH